jgi:pSer/pThr/pTyr-binding forkhead associated (FHA) protein
MAENVQAKSKGFSIDWLVKGTLTKVGDIFDRFTGRGWKPSSSLATSELIERMKSLMDAEVRQDEKGRRYVPHNIQLKMQWDKFSTDSEESLRKLENEFLVAAVDHINDRHYYTYSPLFISIKPDYFTSGVVLLVSFDKFDSDEGERAINVTVDGLKREEISPEVEQEKKTAALRVRFQAGGKQVDKPFSLVEGRRLSVGRTKENDLQIDDQSISKAHASLMLNKEGKLMVADTGSTNGTFIDGQRIAYGKAVEVTAGAALMFGLVNVSVQFAPSAPATKTELFPAKTERYKVGDFEFSTRAASDEPAPTEPSIPVPRTIPSTIAKPDIEEAPRSESPRSQLAASVAPQPALSEPQLKAPQDSMDSEK